MTFAAGNPEHIARVQSQVEARLRQSCYHPLELNDGSVIPGPIPVNPDRWVKGIPLCSTAAPASKSKAKKP